MTRYFWRSLLVLPICALTTGCLTTSPEEQARINEQRCVNRGYKPGTDDFSDCVVRIEGERDARTESNRRYELEKSQVPPSNRGY
jgi:hypothetical protein